MKAELIPLGPLGHHKHVPLKKFPVVVGRAVDAEVQVDDRWISRLHCEIDEVDGTLFVRDMASSNGTFVNGAAVCTSPLLPGDELTVGISMFKIVYERATASDVPPVIYALPCGPIKPARLTRSDLARGARSTHIRFDGTRESGANSTAAVARTETVDCLLDSNPTT